ncbi:MAG: response regulator [Roseivirga sp.]|nr:response regulator [Roseivirga sp.]
MERHKLLRRQIKKYLPANWEENEQLVHFIAAINESYTNYDQDQALSQHAFDIADQEYNEITQKLINEKELRDKSIETLLNSVSQLHEGENTDWISESNDLLNIAQYLNVQVSKRKEIEGQLKRAIRDARNASKAKSQFLSTMSHEIRSPLNVIIGMSHLLQLEDHLPEQVENLEILNIASQNLMLLINDILDYNKIESGKLELDLKPFSLTELITNIKKANSVNAQEKGNQLKLILDSDIPERLIGDGGRLGQIITNLVSNAIKFTNEGTIRMTVSVKKQEGINHLISIRVKDSGIGISKEKQQTIFEQFTQASSNITRQYGGTGLGLAISKRLLELMNSSIEIESEEGEGSTFSFDLWLKEGPSVGKAKFEESDKRDLSGSYILVVDDLEYNLVMIRKILGEWNVKMDLCYNGEEALQRVKEHSYDMVLMDMQMPVMDGKEATREIRKFNRKLPIIAFTALNDQASLDELYSAGMNGYLTKPFNPDEMYNKLRELLNRFDKAELE